MNTTAKTLASELSPLLPLVGNRPTWPILSCALLHHDRARASDMETVAELPVSLSSSWECAVPLKFMVGVLREIGDLPVELSVGGQRTGKLVLSYRLPGVTRSSSATLHCIDSADFPALSPSEWTQLSKLSGADISRIKREIAFAADSQHQKAFRYVGFDGRKVFASDASKLALGETDKDNSTILVAASAMKMAGDIFALEESVIVEIDKERTELKMTGDSGRWLQTTLGVIPYPNLSNLSPSSQDGCATSSLDDLLRATKICRSYHSDQLFVEISSANEIVFHVEQASDNARVLCKPISFTGAMFKGSVSLSNLAQVLLAMGGGPKRPILLRWSLSKLLLYVSEEGSPSVYVLPFSIIGKR